MNNRTLIMAACGLGIALVLWVYKKGGPAGAGQAAGEAVTGAILGAGAGSVLTVGDAIGIPRTDQAQCQQDQAAGKTWDASFSCPAGTFLKYVFS